MGMLTQVDRAGDKPERIVLPKFSHRDLRRSSIILMDEQESTYGLESKTLLSHEGQTSSEEAKEISPLRTLQRKISMQEQKAARKFGFRIQLSESRSFAQLLSTFTDTRVPFADSTLARLTGHGAMGTPKYITWFFLAAKSL